MKKSALTILSMLLGQLSAYPSYGSQSQWQQYTESVREAYQKGKYTEAETAFTLASEEAEKTPGGQLLLNNSLNGLALTYAKAVIQAKFSNF